jgi:transposase-like protein
LKAQIVLESLEDGAIVSDVARRHGVSPRQLFAWRRQLRNQAKTDTATATFAPMVVQSAPEPVAPRALAVAPAAAGSRAEIIVGNAVIRIADGIDARMSALASISVSDSPGPDAVDLGIATFEDDLRQLCFLSGFEFAQAAGLGAVVEPGKPFRAVALDRIAQRLALDAGNPGSFSEGHPFHGVGGR